MLSCDCLSYSLLSTSVVIDTDTSIGLLIPLKSNHTILEVLKRT
jgi:hypothetical protein